MKNKAIEDMDRNELLAYVLALEEYAHAMNRHCAEMENLIRDTLKMGFINTPKHP